MLRRNLIANRSLDVLESRDVPATLDLTTVGASAAANGAIVRQWDTQAAPIQDQHTFLKLHGNGRENGYNTNARPLQFDAVGDRNTTRAISLDRVPTVVENGVTYRQFLLDIKQENRSPYLKLEEVRIFLGSTDNLRGYNLNANTLAGLNSVFNLDGAGDVTVRLNARLNAGNLRGDMFLLVPESAFAGHLPTEFVYLYSNFTGANGGGERWSVGPRQTQTGGTASLSGFVYDDLDGSGAMDNGETGLEGVSIQLQGVDDLGNNVTIDATTGIDGSYSFINLRAGTYTIVRMTDPPSLTGERYLNGGNSVGSLGADGNIDDIAGFDSFQGIHVGAGQVGAGYNFNEHAVWN